MDQVIREYTDDAFVDDDNSSSVVHPYVLSHGTLAVKSLTKSREFYENFLGLTCVQHGMSSMAVRCGMKFHVICLQLGDHTTPAGLHNHWGVDVRSEEEVNKAYEAALHDRDRYEFKGVTKPVKQHGTYSFYIEDRDSNFWEVQYCPGFQHDDIFDFGDRFDTDGQPIA